MTKGQIVTQLAGKFEISKKVAASIIDEYGALAVSETRKKGAFVLPGIGKSFLVKRKARTGRNAATGETIKIPAKTVVRIKPAKAFKEAIVPSKNSMLPEKADPSSENHHFNLPPVAFSSAFIANCVLNWASR